MKKSNVFLLSTLLCTALLFACGSQTDEPNQEEETNPNYREVAALLTRAGRIETKPEKEVVKVVSEEKSKTEEDYTDPVTKKIYKAYAVKRTTHHSVVENPLEFVTLDPWDILWPGALIQGKSLTDGVPAGVPIFSKRRPGKVYLSMVSGNANMDSWYKEVPMSGANVTQAMNELLSKHLDSNPARTAFEVEIVSSTEELALKLGLNLKLWGAKLKQNFGTHWDNKKSYVAVKLNQIFFTMAYDGSDGGINGVFTEDITANDLKSFTGPGNPICYVNSVSYGRSYIMLYESNVTGNELLYSVSAAFGKQAFGAILNSKKIFNESRCKLVQIGGDPVAGLETTFGNFDKIKDFIEKGAVVSTKNIGAPISFKISHLIDNSNVRLSNTLEYDFTSQTFVSSEPRNNVSIDIFDATMPTPSSNRNISNFSGFILKKVILSLLDKQGKKIDDSIDMLEDKSTSYATAHTTANIPIYEFHTFQRVAPDSRIRIESEFYVKNETYKGSRQMDEGTFRVVQDFEYDAQKRAWQEVEKRDKPFSELSMHKDNFGGASMDFRLRYRFSCDGRIYPLQ